MQIRPFKIQNGFEAGLLGTFRTSRKAFESQKTSQYSLQDHSRTKVIDGKRRGHPISTMGMEETVNDED
jgi:hypothetical protein